ncbi:hypothetical protein Trydic_g13810 [Trypoxylus dichotomus]
MSSQGLPYDNSESTRPSSPPLSFIPTLPYMGIKRIVERDWSKPRLEDFTRRAAVSLSYPPSAAPRRTHKGGLQPTGMHRGGIPRRRQSLRQGLAPGPTTEDAPSRHLQCNGDARSLLSPQEDLPSQAGRTAVHHKDGHSRRAAMVSDLSPAVQHVHQRHSDNRARQPGDVRGRCLHVLQVSQYQSDRPTSPDSTRHFTGLVRKVENRRPSPEKHGRAFRDRRSPKKEVRQRAGSHLPRRHHSLAT